MSLPLSTSKNLTILGISTIVGALAVAVGALFDGNPTTNVDWGVTVAAVVSGIGMILAKGSSNTGGTVGPDGKAVLPR